VGASWLLVVLLASAGCAGAGPGASSSPPPRPSVATGSPAPLAASQDWSTYHADAARSGALRTQTAGNYRSALEAWPSKDVDGDVYASPVVAAGIVVVATENDSVYGFDAASGQQRWKVHLAEPVAASTLPCGGIQPVSGITSTPVADPAKDVVYVVAFVRPAQHVLYSVKLSTGDVLPSHPVVDPPGETPITHQQRGALVLANGYLYIPYGGLLGDCGQYHGWVIGVPPAGGDMIGYKVPCDRECAIWAPAGPAVDEKGDLWVATGNGEPFDRFTYSNSVLRLTPDLKLRDYFAPRDWADLSRSDRDLGSMAPVLLAGGLVWASGKGSTGYLLRRDHLGGVGGQAFSGPSCNTFSSALAAGSRVYVACPFDGRLMAFSLDLARPSFSPAWDKNRNAPGGPILAFGLLWVIDTGSGTLAAVDPQSGDERFAAVTGAGSTPHFVTPASDGARVYAALGRRLFAVVPTGG
jgi:polyvinyl alcohol dehydrogenase (cytochrome)